jgi:hypothetical protein
VVDLRLGVLRWAVVGAGVLEVGGVLGAAATGLGVSVGVGVDDGSCAELVEHAATSVAATASAAPIRRKPTRSGCHETPMRMRGCAEGVSQCINDTSFVCEIATHPAVGAPSVTCRKNALPAPRCTPPGALRVLASMTTA